MAKATVMVLQMGDAAGDNRQQMIAFSDKSVFRRTLGVDHSKIDPATGKPKETRTRWRYSSVGDLSEFIGNYVSVAVAPPTPMELSHGPVLMEVNDDEVAQAASGSLERNVGLRLARVLDHMNKVGPVVKDSDIQGFIEQWTRATADDNDTWLDANIHTAGTAKDPAPDPDPEPEPAPVITAPAGLTWTYPAIKGGYVERPNGMLYKCRKLLGETDVTVMRDSRALGEHVLLTGVPGTGKTALLEASFGTEMVNMLGTEDTEVADFIGSYVTRGVSPKGDVIYGWAQAALSEAIERDVPLYVDECGVIITKVLTVLYSMMDGRKEYKVTTNPDVGTLKAGPGFIIVAATNPDAPGVRFSEALTSRFSVICEVTTDYALMRELGVPSELVTAAENLEGLRVDGPLSWSPQARELLQAKQQWETRSPKFAVANLIGKAPREDQDEVAEKFKNATGMDVGPLRL